MIRLLIFFLFFTSQAFAQQVTTPPIMALACAYNSAVPTPTSGKFFYVQCDSSGKVLTSGSGSSTITAGSTATSGFSAGNLLYSNGSTVAAFATTISGSNITVPGAIQFPAGSVSAPSVAVGVSNTGIYQGTNGIGIAVNGNNRADFGLTTAGQWTFPTTLNMGASIAGGATLTVVFGTRATISSPTIGVISIVGGSSGPGAILTNPSTVSGLMSAVTAGVGARAFVTDATACTLGTTVSGGGSTACPVYSDGTNWKGGG